MSRVYKTARGKMVDMDKVKLSNEQVIAVGNMKINARGDKIGANGQIEMSKNQIMDQVFAVEDGYSPNDPSNFNKLKANMDASKAKELHDLATNLVKPSTVKEEIVPETPTTPEGFTPAPTTRGSLASSVAKTVSVVQQPEPSPTEIRKAKGPSRI